MNLRELFHLPLSADKLTLINPPRIQGMMTGALMACVEPSGRVTILYEDHSTESALVPAPVPQEFIPLVGIVQALARKPKLKTAAALRAQDTEFLRKTTQTG